MFRKLCKGKKRILVNFLSIFIRFNLIFYLISCFPQRQQSPRRFYFVEGANRIILDILKGLFNFMNYTGYQRFDLIFSIIAVYSSSER